MRARVRRARLVASCRFGAGSRFARGAAAPATPDARQAPGLERAAIRADRVERAEAPREEASSRADPGATRP